MRSIFADYSQKSATKRWVFFIFFCLWLSVRVGGLLTFDVWPSFPVTTWTLPLCPILARLSYSRLNVLILHFFPFIFRGFLIAVACLTRAAYLAALRQLRSPFAIRDARLETIKDKNIWWKKSPFVTDFGCNRLIWTSFNDWWNICDPK